MSQYFDRDLHTKDGGEGLPPFPTSTVGALDDKSDANDDVYLFTCVDCGCREANPHAPLSGCSCGGDVVCHVFHYTEYKRIRWYDDPREKDFDGGEHDPEIMTDGGRDVDAVSALAERMAEDLCLGFRWHDQRDRERAVEAFARVDVLQFPHVPASEAREAARAYVDALWEKDAIEADCIPNGGDEPDADQLAAADWSGVEDAFAERAYRIGIDELYAAASTLAWKRHKTGGDYWTPMLRGQRAELRAAMQDPEYPGKPSDGDAGFGPEAVRYLLGVELHDQHSRSHWRQAQQAMVPYFERILRSHKHHQVPAIGEDAPDSDVEAEPELVADGGRPECTDKLCGGEAKWALWMPGREGFSRVVDPHPETPQNDRDLHPYVCDSCLGRYEMAHGDNGDFVRPEEKLVTDGGTTVGKPRLRCGDRVRDLDNDDEDAHVYVVEQLEETIDEYVIYTTDRGAEQTVYDYTRGGYDADEPVVRVVFEESLETFLHAHTLTRDEVLAICHDLDVEKLDTSEGFLKVYAYPRSRLGDPENGVATDGGVHAASVPVAGPEWVVSECFRGPPVVDGGDSCDRCDHVFDIEWRPFIVIYENGIVEELCQECKPDDRFIGGGGGGRRV